jgi:hypothetical protein
MYLLDQAQEGMNIILLATGTSLAPYMCMQGTQSPCGNPRSYVGRCSAYHDWNMRCCLALTALKTLSANFTCIATVDCPQGQPVEWMGPAGLVKESLQIGVNEDSWGYQTTPDNLPIILCGNPTLIVESE